MRKAISVIIVISAIFTMTACSNDQTAQDKLKESEEDLASTIGGVFEEYGGWSKAIEDAASSGLYTLPTSKPSSTLKPTEDPTATPNLTARPETTEEPSNESESTAAPEPTPTPKPEETITAGQRNALKKASDYLSFMPFSYESLIGQLEYEKFTHEESVYAADHCGADWNEQALEKAKSYLRIAAFSYSGLKDQLEYEKFTADQAQYGVDHCGADWKEQAAKKAESYLEMMSFSRDGLIDQLIYEGFTREEAVYGVDQAGLSSTKHQQIKKPRRCWRTSEGSPRRTGWSIKTSASYIVPPDPGKSNSPSIFMPKISRSPLRTWREIGRG